MNEAKYTIVEKQEYDRLVKDSLIVDLLLTAKRRCTSQAQESLLWVISEYAKEEYGC